jgi:hypothetical protein
MNAMSSFSQGLSIACDASFIRNQTVRQTLDLMPARGFIDISRLAVEDGSQIQFVVPVFECDLLFGSVTVWA